jgi:hypothetical protein
MGMMNRVVIAWLDGRIGKVLSGSLPPRVEHQSIWSSRFLRLVFEVFRGLLTLELVDAPGNVCSPVIQMLAQSTTRLI